MSLIKFIREFLCRKFDFYLVATSSLLFCLLVQTGLFAQDALDRPVSVNVNAVKLSAVLDQLSAKENINFSFNPSDPSFSRVITYKADNKPLGDVLKDIFTGSGHDYRLVGNQVVVFALDGVYEPVSQEPQRAAVASPPIQSPPEVRIVEIPSEPEIITETIRITDTIILVDTILRVDTLLIRDTVFIEREAVRTAKPEQPKPLRESVFRVEPNRLEGWYMGAYYQFMIASNSYSANDVEDDFMEMLQESESLSWNNSSIGLEISRFKGNLQFSGGLQFTRFSSQFNYIFEETQGGFFRTDTIESYYQVIQNDTTWFYLTDSTWIPVERTEITYNQINRLSYVEVPLMFGYRIYHDQDFSISLTGGFIPGFLVGRKGYTIQNAEGYPAVSYDDLEFSTVVFSYALGAAFRYRISTWFDINAELGYRKHIGSLIKDYPVDWKINAGGVKIGIIYYL